MIDIHCHILPGIDDGSPDINTSLKMAKIAAKDGIRAIIATPHVGDDDLKRELIVEKTESLNSELKQRKIDVTIYPGAEIEAHLALSLADFHPLGFSKFILIEFPHSFLPTDSTILVKKLAQKGLKTIIAHAERNYDVVVDPEKIKSLVQVGAEVQMTAESLTGSQGPDVKRCAEYLLRRGWVHYIASDSHSPAFRKPILSKAVKVASRLIGKKEAIKLVTTNPEKIIACK